jgi:hypothetical protein
MEARVTGSMGENFKGRIFKGIQDLREYLKTKVTDIKGDECFVPFLQSDYAIVIYKGSKPINASDFDPVLIQSLDLSPLKNGFSSQMDMWGLQSVNFNANNALTFSYLGVPYTYVANSLDEYYGAKYTSIIHYYYARRFANNGTLRIKLAGEEMPSVMIINTKSNNIIYSLYNCTFSCPTFEASPQSNTVVLYKTTVTYSSFKEYLGDDLTKGYENNNGLFGNVNTMNEQRSIEDVI